MVRVNSFIKPLSKLMLPPKLYPIPNDPDLEKYRSYPFEPKDLMKRGGFTYHKREVVDLKPIQSQKEIPGRDHYMDAFRQGLKTKIVERDTRYRQIIRRY
ncbi:unnamed protein product [Blepharisma stoltei]|uniref:Uncharacterized protein n=1 Tax=Blepharisma stoltei TaxID=1481888 RepID=A0AAU9K8Y1_9CILI|nr:unnamed protein product [Blepharisma stoltei]